MRKFEVFRTEGQVKKHVSQMTGAEIAFLNKKLDAIMRVKKSRHLLNRKDTGGIPHYIFRDILRNKRRRTIIEYNETLTKTGRISKRILVRDTYVVKRRFLQAHEYESCGNAVLCFVIDYETGEIITAYYNFAEDSHHTVDMSRYDEKLAICA